MRESKFQKYIYHQVDARKAIHERLIKEFGKPKVILFYLIDIFNVLIKFILFGVFFGMLFFNWNVIEKLLKHFGLYEDFMLNGFRL